MSRRVQILLPQIFLLYINNQAESLHAMQILLKNVSIENWKNLFPFDDISISL